MFMVAEAANEDDIKTARAYHKAAQKDIDEIVSS